MTPLEATTGAVAGITVCLLVIPAICYLRIILRFLRDRDLQTELKGLPQTPAAGAAKQEPMHVLPAPPPVLLSFLDVGFRVPDRADPNGELRPLLQGVSGWFAPHVLTAILGTSGCGKSTLLSVLLNDASTNAPTSQKAGDIRVNGRPVPPAFRQVAAFVMQSDNLIEALTTRETLWFTAELRLSGSLSQTEKLAVVHEVLGNLRLSECCDRPIGVLSGGQKRRVTCAIELMARPSLILLDEPTSGLDAYGSLSLVRALRHLCDLGRTVACTIHQPRVDAFSLFHMALILNAGRTVYFGPVQQIIRYFSNPALQSQLSFKQPGAFALATPGAAAAAAPTNAAEKTGNGDSKTAAIAGGRNVVDDEEETENPADFVLDLTNGSVKQVAALCSFYDESSLALHTIKAIERIHHQEKCASHFLLEDDFFEDDAWSRELHVLPQQQGVVVVAQPQLGRMAATFPGDQTCRSSFASSMWKQTFTLVRRGFFSDVRNRGFVMTWVLGIVMMLFLGMLYSSVSAPPFNLSELPQVERNLQDWGACTQNTTALGAILGQTPDQVNLTLLQCGQDITSMFQLSLARVSLLYQILVSMFFSEFPFVGFIYKDRLIYAREYASGSYSNVSWTLSWAIRLLFAGMLKGLIYPPFVYFSAQLPIHVTPYVLFSIFVGAMSTAGATSALLVTVLFDSFETALVAFVLVKSISQIMCGYYITSNYMPWYFRWIYYCNFFTYTFEGAVLAQRLSPENQRTANLLNLTAHYNTVQERAWTNALVSVLFSLAFIVLTGLVVFYKSRRGAMNNTTTTATRCRLGSAFSWCV